ncbi:MAG: hypothetical protein HFH85_19730 [Lachnospiraceae bacterium]|nr:hypothetical protein [Lachnospiraceae bacterium]
MGKKKKKKKASKMKRTSKKPVFVTFLMDGKELVTVREIPIESDMVKERKRMDIEKTISEFMKRQAEEQRAARKKERLQVCIKPDSYIGKEIMYQTALMHEILAELRKDKGSGKAARVDQLEKTELS